MLDNQWQNQAQIKPVFRRNKNHKRAAVMKATSVQKILLASFMVLIPLALWQTIIWAERFALDALRRNAAQNLNLVVKNLRGEQEKFRALTRLIARQPTFRNLLNGTLSEDEIATLNLSLEKISAFTDAMDIYIMDKNGLTVAASNWNMKSSFIGRNFSYRPYFEAAMQGRLGRYFAMGTTSGRRGYYFAYPIRSGSVITGALVIKMDVSHLESLWWSHDFDIIVTDTHGVIFLSTTPEWVFKSLKPLNAAQMKNIRASRQYADLPIAPLNASPGYSFSGAKDLISIPVMEENGRFKDPRKYLRRTASIAEAQWDITILARMDTVRPQILLAAAIMGVLLVSLGFLSAYMFERRRRIKEQIILQQQAQETLEKKVRLRTDDLAQANVKLRTQIAERSRAESELRRAQQELIQASRMAALGQVSAGLSHELNQPLAAIRSYADNARAYLTRNAPQKAISNLTGISELTDRMARIIKHLRTYARKDIVKPYPTPVAAMIDEALSLHKPQLTEKDIEVIRQYPGDDPLALAGEVRLQQVFANLISNAIDAMENAPEKRLTIALQANHSHVLVSFHNTGISISKEDMAKLFDPFFTTKEVGEGMGLGLSISYGIIKQFGGSIEVNNHARGGACFSLKLPLAIPEDGAAS